MKRLLVSFQQMGGANALNPLLGELSSTFDIAVTGRTLVCEQLKRKGMPARCFGELGWDFRNARNDGEWFARLAPSLVITDTIKMARDPEEGDACRDLWRFAKERGVPSIAYVDSWWAYDERFRLPGEAAPQLPDKIAVVDSLIRDELLSLGYPAERIAVVGSPRFETLRKEQRDGTAARKKLGIGDDDFLLVFISQPIERVLGSVAAWGFSEKTVLRALREEIAALGGATARKVFLAVMLHPEEDGAAAEEIIGREGNSLRHAVLREGNDSLDIIAAADLVTGMFSILLTEAVIMRKPVLSIQLDLKQPDMLVTNLVGATAPARSRAELAELLPKAVLDTGFRAGLIERQKRFEVVEDSSARWMALINDLSHVTRQ